ncbi:MAG: polysaccharide export protein [Methylococcaceae bacterium]|jgi:polysaccharide export outer membrane protein|nr:polysaccharide export protein [Methylococcaceae bacterium]MDZ4157434.1 XrtA/PEP-CTERM system exopolysaccharide export protein [Methylococcales bacterium]MDP2393651.1 polysaccharide export protein [Methylococcaceae bacterium]MDP3020713.1 polysaccharide export protein [Methylococcaceae bacterium]MDP3390460.1 polysaccharide export protein [Methylococcaceae bacterium]
MKVRFFYKLILAYLFILLASGCGYHQLSQDDAVAVPSDYTYIIGPGDSVNIFVWGNPDISTTATVRPDGKITIPLAEDLPASGKTPSQLAREMEKKLAKYVRDPQVVIMVGGFQGVYSQQVRIVGQLSGGSSSGSGGGRFSAKAFPYKKDMTLLDLMIQLGGLGQYSDGNRASIVRNINGELQQFGIRIDNLINDADLSANVLILPGDIVIIPEAFF